MQGEKQYLRPSLDTLMTGSDAWLKHNVKHELGHAIGLWHEQQRLDREDYIVINWFCMPSSRWHNFEERGTPLGAYDFDSIMHYNSWAFSNDETGTTCPTIFRGDGGWINTAWDLSAGDVATINMLYQVPRVPHSGSRGGAGPP